MNLSKSRFMSGLQCRRQLWWRAHEPGAPELRESPERRAFFDEGTRVEERARDRFPGGVRVEGRGFEDSLRAARTEIARGMPVLFGATFGADGLSAAVDVLDRSQGAPRLVEVKSSTRVKNEHIPDVAFQAHVLGRAGLAPERIELMHLNPDYRHPGGADLFVREDVTERVLEMLPEIPGQVEAQQHALAGALPAVGVGSHCFEPHECPFRNRCFSALPAHHVVTLYRQRGRAAELEARGCVTIGDLPDDLPLEPVAHRQRLAVRTARIVVAPGLKDALQALAPPLAFLDFETVGPAVPAWDGCGPWEDVPVQFSCHVEDGGGGHAHHHWIAPDGSDPRAAIARRVVEACRGAGTVLVYYADFELGCLRRLEAAVPARAGELESIRQRVADLLVLVRDFVYHPDFNGSFSIKSVLPALVPELSYAGLPIAGGERATYVLRRLLFEPDAVEPGEAARLRRDLARYCTLDTWAMVKLLERLRGLAATG